MQLRSNEIKELPDKEVLHLKKWQSNGFYPIEIAERVSNGWVVYSVNTVGRKYGFHSYTDKSFLYLLRNNSYLVSDTPMRNENVYNFE